MRRRFGQFSSDKTTGLLRPLFFPSMARMDEWTGDRRLLEAQGGGVRTLPRPIFAQFAQSFGHNGSVPIGSLQEVTLEDDGNVTGRGWLLDQDYVRDLFVPLIATKTLFHNSVDLAEVEIRWGSDDFFDDAFWDMIMTRWNVAATTLVGVPAFADAHATLEDFDDELVASFCACDEPVEIDFAETKLFIPGIDDAVELTADGGRLLPDFAIFCMPEPDAPTPHTVDADGRVFGHLADWQVPHAGNGRFCPRPASYASYHQGSVLTDRGLVRTGTIFFLGGHPDHPLDTRDVTRAYGGIENAWADVVVTNGRHGPWYCGQARPGLSAEAMYQARASGISGHWVGGDLHAIVSCNVRGLTIPGSTLAADRDGAIVRDGKVLELVASLHSVAPVEVTPPATPAPVTTSVAATGTTSWIVTYPNGTTITAPISLSTGEIAPIPADAGGEVVTSHRESCDDRLDAELDLLELELAMAPELPLADVSGNDSTIKDD
jgi:hypothetical protein